MAPETPKGVSSRLLTMKFMQRAAASASSTGSPESDVPSSKKRKLDHSPAQGRINPNIDQALIQAALDDQESTRLAALEKHSAADTHWVLKTNLDKQQSMNQAKPSLNIMYVGYGDIDSSNESGDNEDIAANGRMSTKRHKKKDEVSLYKSVCGEMRVADVEHPGQDKPNASKADDEDEDSSNDESNEGSQKRTTRPSDANSNSSARDGRSRSQSRSRYSKEDGKLREFREKRRKKEVRLNNLTSISSAGDSQFGSQGSPGSKGIKCYNCQQVGHKATDCPRGGSRNSRNKS